LAWHWYSADVPLRNCSLTHSLLTYLYLFNSTLTPVFELPWGTWKGLWFIQSHIPYGPFRRSRYPNPFGSPSCSTSFYHSSNAAESTHITMST